jgi:hypothetical protein
LSDESTPRSAANHAELHRSKRRLALLVAPLLLIAGLAAYLVTSGGPSSPAVENANTRARQIRTLGPGVDPDFPKPEFNEEKH